MTSEPWWQSAVIYQIYPRSFMDASGDGVGDLAGIEARLDYLTDLGVDALWLSPIYVSPMVDFGYDIADHRAIDARFGTLADFDRLIAAVHARGLKLILDFVPNHTSDRHPWFEEARRSRSASRRDWYIWRDPGPGGRPPNNWLSLFGGPAWTFDPLTEQYYYHAFLKEQPDLNWRNPAVVEAMHDVLRFWLARGVDGFRVDVLWQLAKDAAFRDEPANPHWRPGMDPYHKLDHVFSCDQPEIHGIVAALRRVIEDAGSHVFIGEIYLPIERLVAYYGPTLEGAHLPFNFHLLTTPWEPGAIADLVTRYEAALPAGAWPNWVLGNHDRPRLASRIGLAQARVAAMLLLTLRGTPTLYYGDELGLSDVAIPPARVQDPWEKNLPGLGLGRDPVRTPMPWDASAHAGFSPVEPWLPLNADYATRNVAHAAGDPRSLLALYRALLALRRRRPALQRGAWALAHVEGNVLCYSRAATGEHLLVALNMGAAPQTLSLPTKTRTLLSTTLDPARAGLSIEGHFVLAGHEGVILEIPKSEADRL